MTNAHVTVWHSWKHCAASVVCWFKVQYSNICSYYYYYSIIIIIYCIIIFLTYLQIWFKGSLRELGTVWVYIETKTTFVFFMTKYVLVVCLICTFILKINVVTNLLLKGTLSSQRGCTFTAAFQRFRSMRQSGVLLPVTMLKPFTVLYCSWVNEQTIANGEWMEQTTGLNVMKLTSESHAI